MTTIFFLGTVLLIGGVVFAEETEEKPLQDVLKNDRQAYEKFGALSATFSERLKTLLRRREDQKAMELLKVMVAYEQRRRLAKCRETLSESLCANSSPEAFNLWAKVAARELMKDPSEELRHQLLSGLNNLIESGDVKH